MFLGGTAKTLLLKAFPPAVIGIMFVEIAVLVGGVMVLMGFLGRFIDSQINTQPWFTVALIVFGTIVSSYLAYKVGSRAVNKSQASYAKWREEQMAEKIDLE